MNKIIAIVLLLLSNASVLAQNDHQESLRGLPGVRILVERLSPDAERDGLLSVNLQTWVELSLRKARIAVLDEDQSLLSYLYLNVSTMKSEKGFYAFCVDLEFKQAVNLSRTKKLIFAATTWHKGETGFTGKEGLSKGIREVVDELMDVFVNDYLAVNPK